MTEARPFPPFVGDAPGLDFLNAIAPNPAAPEGAIVTGEDLVAWLAKARLAEPADLIAARQNVLPSELDAVAKRARALGDWFRSFVSSHRGKPLAPGALGELAPLNRVLESDIQIPQVEAEATPDGPRFVRRTHRSWSSPEALIWPLAEVMSRLVCELFVDRTRGRARRWCDMAVCGNRAKQAAHKQRLAATTRRTSKAD
jgi:hypothetical protein